MNSVDKLVKTANVTFYRSVLSDIEPTRIEYGILYHDTDEKNRYLDGVSFKSYGKDGNLEFSGSLVHDNSGTFMRVIRSYADLATSLCVIRQWAGRLKEAHGDADEMLKAAISHYSEQYVAAYNLLKAEKGG